MKKTLLILAAALSGALAASAQTGREWQDPAVNEINRLPMHSTFAAGESMPLDGVWKFHWVRNASERPSGIWQVDYDDASWGAMPVPGMWELNGYGDPLYVNIGYAWRGNFENDPPHVPDAENHVGSYRHTFEVPASWSGKDIFLSIGSATSNVYVWINGRFVGYSEDSKLAAEFDVTKFVKPGENLIALQMFRWSDGTYLEDQDFWRFSGIARGVTLTARDKAHLKDVRITPTFDADYRDAQLRVEVETTPHVKSVGLTLLDAAGEAVAEQQIRPAGGKAGCLFRVADPAKWSAEAPNLYTLRIDVSDGRNVTETVTQPVGFRSVEIRNAQLLVNGQPVKFKGVNLHEHDPRTGHYVDEELLLRDMRLMKAHNVNAIRTCHYPQQRRFYELCDSLGFYVYSEANVESHGMGYDLAAGRTLGNDRAWWPAHETRLRNMYMRCRNYPSVSIFSPANESGNGYNFYKAYEWLEAREKGEGRMNRPICYERAQWEWNTDMFVPMYPAAGMLEEWGREGTDRPVVPCEYSHAMGNSNGSLWLQWQSIYKYPNLQGGFIWDWVDQGFERRDAAGTLYWTYGGDYGDREPSDGNFCCNGLVSPDRTPHPAMAEVRYAYADIAFRPVGPARGSFEVENRFYFTSLDGYDIVYTVEADGKAVRSGTVRLQTAPQQRETVDAAVGKLKPGRNYYLRLRAVTRTDRPGLPAGTVVAEEQFPLQKGALPAYEKEGERLALSTQGDRIEAANDRVRFAVNRTTGAALSYEIDGTELFADGFGVRPNFWRAPVDNDYGDGMPRRTQVWKEASRDADAEVTGRMEGDAAVIAATRALAGGNRVTTTYTVYPSGAVNVRMHFAPGEEPMPEMPRYGVRFRLPERMDAFAYFGRGPEENYWDRKAGTFVGRYETSARRECFPYVRPQETGHHCDTEWIDFGELLIVADSTMEFNALRCTVEDLDGEQAVGRDYQWHNWTKSDSNEADKARNAMRRQTHVNDIPVRDFVEVCLDYRQMGLGGYDSWGKRPEESVTLRTGKLRDWGFTLVPKRARK